MKRSFDRIKVVWLVTAMALAGALAVASDAAPMRPGPGGGMPPGLFLMGDPARIDATVERMLAGSDATAEQREQVKSILKSAATDLAAQREASRGLHEQSMQLFAQPTVDAKAAEALRKKMMAAQDKSSRRMLQAMLDVSNVLTPEQRQKMSEAMARPPHFHHKEAGQAASPPPDATR